MFFQGKKKSISSEVKQPIPKPSETCSQAFLPVEDACDKVSDGFHNKLADLCQIITKILIFY